MSKPKSIKPQQNKLVQNNVGLKLIPGFFLNNHRFHCMFCNSVKHVCKALCIHMYKYPIGSQTYIVKLHYILKLIFHKIKFRKTAHYT